MRHIVKSFLVVDAHCRQNTIHKETYFTFTPTEKPTHTKSHTDTRQETYLNLFFRSTNIIKKRNKCRQIIWRRLAGAKVRWVRQDARWLIAIFCSVSVYYFPTEEDDEDGPTFSDKALETFRRCIDIFCVWDCCWPWLKFQEGVAWLVFDPFTELFITLCIVVNTLFMALDHHDMDKDMEAWLKKGNYVRVIRQMRKHSFL